VPNNQAVERQLLRTERSCGLQTLRQIRERLLRRKIVDDADRLLLAVQRPSRVNASGLMVACNRETELRTWWRAILASVGSPLRPLWVNSTVERPLTAGLPHGSYWRQIRLVDATHSTPLWRKECCR